MPSVILAGTTTGSALSLTSDTSGELQIRTNNGATTAMTLTTGGNINIPTSGARITGDMSNATHANRLSFQTSTTNGATSPFILPNGTGNSASVIVANASDPTNSSFGQLTVVGTTDVRVVSGQLGTGIFLPLSMFTSGAERLRIDTSGNVGIGTSIPESRLHIIGGNDSNNFGYITIERALNPSGIIFRSFNGAIGAPTQKLANERVMFLSGQGYTNTAAYSATTCRIDFFAAENLTSTAAGGYITFNTTPIGSTSIAERMRIDSSGNLLVGTTNQIRSASNTVQILSGTTLPLVMRNTSSSAGNFYSTGPDTANNYCVYNHNNTGVFVANGATSWSANSDERLKTSLVPFNNAVEKISSIRAGTGRYLTDDKDVSRSFLVAQDVQKVLPEAVNVKNDEIGTLGLSYTDVIPLLVASIKELKAELDSVKAELQTLKGN